MAKRRRRKKGGGGAGIVALLIAAVVAAGYFFKDCLPGFGIGGGGGSGTAESPEDKTTDDPKPAGEKGTVVIVVNVENCTIDGGESSPCPKVAKDMPDEEKKTKCEPILVALEGKRVELQATLGAQEVVDSVQECLKVGGITDVVVHSE